MEDYSKFVTFLPVTKKSNEKNISTHVSNLQESSQFFRHKLNKGKYDINYVIMLLKIIQDQNEKMKLNPKDFQFTLAQSLQKLICMLEVERDQEKI